MRSKLTMLGLAATMLMVACYEDKNQSDPLNPPPAPTIVAHMPRSDSTDVPITTAVSVVFDMEMDAGSFDERAFTLLSTTSGLPVEGVSSYDEFGFFVDFIPNSKLENDELYIATITTGVTSLEGIPLEEDFSWMFTTVATGMEEPPVDLGTAGEYVILSKAGISNVPTSAITGNMGVSPIAASAITGFALAMDPSNEFSTSTQVTGQVFASDYAPPTPSNLTIAVLDMQAAFTDAAGRAPDYTELGAGDVSGMTLTSGVYKWGTGLLIATDVTLAGNATDVWIFQIAGDLTVSTSAMVILSGGALPKNIFWQVSGFVDLGTSAHLEGVVLTATAVTMGNGVSVNGRLLAQTAVTIDGSTIVQPAP